MAVKSYLTPRIDKTKQTAPPVVELSLPSISDDDLLPASVVQSKAAEPVAAPAVAAAPVVPAGGVFMTAADIAEIVKAAVAGVTAASNTATADVISQALTQHMGPRRLTVADIGEPKTPFNPEGKTRILKCDYYQNGYPISERYVSDAEIEMLHQLVPGSYGTPEMPVAVIEKKRLNGKTRVFILHADGKDDRLKIKNYAPNFHALLVKLVQEAKEQKAERRAEARALLADE